MRRSGVGLGGRGRGLVGTVARTAVIAGTASAVAGRMAQRHEARKHHQQAQVEEQAATSLAAQQEETAGDEATPAGALSAESIARLTQLVDLHKQGILTDEELAAQKAKILGA